MRRFPTRRHLVAGAILAGWLLTLGWHVRREYFRPPELELAMGARGLAPGTHFYVVRMDGTAIGYSSARFDTLPDGYRFEDNTLLEIPALGEVQRATTRSRVDLDQALTLRSFEFALSSGIGAFRAEGTLGADSALDVRIDAGGDQQRSRLQVTRDVLLDAAVPLRLAAAGALEVGREFTVSVFDPSAMEQRRVSMRVAAADTFIVVDSVLYEPDTRTFAPNVYDTVPAWRLDQEIAGATVETWVDEDGQVVRATSPLGFEIERTVYELARAEFDEARARPGRTAGYGSVIESTAIASNADLADVEFTPRLAVRLRNVELDGFDLPGGRQELRGDTLIITRESSMHATYALPWTGGGEPAAELAASPLIQKDDPAIVRAAREATRGTSDPAEAARLLNEWVYRALDKQITLSVPSARQVLDARQGDCNEHTVLYVAMARAIGLPARTAVGVVHVDGRFYYHAWPEVWLGEEWYAVDPTLGQVPADASHLRFLIGGLARQVELVRLIGRLQLEVV
ncbi:MAG TPA: transglutaminase-like domain-containing protein [Longimicrobiales bacterium]|nr:transglutaminase-like domain-containing protein [Longimicrobiales bacterium]